MSEVVVAQYADGRIVATSARYVCSAIRPLRMFAPTARAVVIGVVTMCVAMSAGDALLRPMMIMTTEQTLISTSIWRMKILPE